MPRTASSLTQSQVLLLQVLARPQYANEGLSRDALATEAQTPASLDNLGPTYADAIDKYPDSLYAQKMVAVSKFSSDSETLFRVTAMGRKTAERYTAKPRILNGDKIPPEILDKAIIEVRVAKTYSIELYTSKDLQEVREACGKKFAEISDESLIRQMANRRKEGAFSEPFSPNWPAWYRSYRKDTHFAKVADKMLKLHGGCTVNEEHTEDLAVIHRRFLTTDGETVIGQENPEDLMVLCLACHKRNAKQLQPVPSKSSK